MRRVNYSCAYNWDHDVARLLWQHINSYSRKTKASETRKKTATILIL